jgi:anaerobic magnesium-protoporphyrin IX monomethyl ester cyclase
MKSETSGSTSIVLVGFQDQDNLGLRYLMSSVQQAGFTAQIVTYQSNPEPLVELALKESPPVIGFSLIFQYMAPDFCRVIQALREAGVTAHITMGGHYPSFDHAEVLRRIPGLDSIVRFEGEPTLVELMQKLEKGEDWRKVRGIAYRAGEEIIATPLRPSVEDLDTLPWPNREDINYLAHELPTASVLGSRGCPWDCTFCSIRPFYEAQEGPLRRLRRPEAIVEEMYAIHRERGVPVFLFQDDDFLAGGQRAREWACKIADGLVRKGVAGKLVFKISCRSDEIREDCMRQLMAGGLTHVYMGVENGDPQGLINMSKRIKPEQHLNAGRLLKELGLSFDFGFMVLDPYSTFEMVRNNIDFLDTFVGDGWAVASFCRMLPYAGTPLKSKLEKEGRLLGTPFEPDYRFLDPKLDFFYDWMLETFHERNFTNRGLCHILKSMLFEARLRLTDRQRFTDFDQSYVQHLTAVCNGLAIYTLRTALDYIEATPLNQLESDQTFLKQLTRNELEEEQRLMEDVVDFYWNVRHRPAADSRTAEFETVGSFENTWTHAAATAAP